MSVKVVELKKDYKIGSNVVHAVYGVSFEIKDGMFVAIMGASGCGKTTLLHLIGGLDKVTSGKVIVNDHDLSKMNDTDLSRFRCCEIGFVFQKFNLINEMTVMENIVTPVLISKRKVNEQYVKELTEILGLSEVPQAGDYFEVVKNEKEMKAIVADRKEKERDKRLEAMLPAHIRREAVAGDDDIPQLNLIIKANTHGSAEAVAQAIAQVESKEITTKIIHVGVGDISEADVMLASASNALILGFTVKEDANALAAAEKEGVTIKKYDIIYQVLEDIESTMISLLTPEIKEVATGEA